MKRFMSKWALRIGLVWLVVWPQVGMAEESVAVVDQAYDGAAKAWVNNGQLCLGLEPSYGAGGLMAEADQVAKHPIILNALLVHKHQQVVWQAHAAKIDAMTVKMVSQTCLPYGKTPTGMIEVMPAQPLSQGLYTVMLVGSDEQHRRAWFYQHFCVGANPNRLSVTAATFDAKSKAWQCP